MAQNDQATAETGPNFRTYEGELTVTPALKRRQIKNLRKTIAMNGGALPHIIGLSQGFGEAIERSTLLRFEDKATATGAISLVESIIGSERLT